MKKTKPPLSVKLFKTKKYIADKKSNTKYFFKRLIKHNFIVKSVVFLSRTIKTLFKNLENNADNWNRRRKVDENFLIDD